MTNSLQNVPLSCERPRVLRPGSPEEIGLDPARLGEALQGVSERVGPGHKAPGAVVLVARFGVVAAHQAFGCANWGHTPDPPVLTVGSIFDLLSMTKPLTGLLALKLEEEGALGLGDSLAKYIPGAAPDITLDALLSHSAGLAGMDVDITQGDRLAAMVNATNDPAVRQWACGVKVEYSDLGYRLLGLALEKAGGAKLDVLMRQKIFGPLKMTSTGFRPGAHTHDRQAGTGWSESRQHDMIGEVCDDQDLLMGGIAGCDGLFSTAWDYAVFAQMCMNRGSYAGVNILSPEDTLRLTGNATPFVSGQMNLRNRWESLMWGPKGRGFERRVLNTDLAKLHPPYTGQFLCDTSFVKAGGAGTFVAVDPSVDLIMIYLTNHGVPSFDGFGYDADGHPVWPGWDAMLDELGPDLFFNGIMQSIVA